MQHQGAQAYQKVAQQTVSPRELEANLLSKSAMRLQRVRDGWADVNPEFFPAITFNRKLWSVFLNSVMGEDSPLPQDVRENVANLGAFVLKHTIALQLDPAPHKLDVLININRNLAAGLRASAETANAG